MNIFRKYGQISLILFAFFLLVFIKDLQSKDSQTEAIRRSINPSLQTPGPTTVPGKSLVTYRNGTYTGTTEDAYYGNIQVQVVIAQGMINDVVFLQYPNDNRTSLSINTQAIPFFKSEAIQAQSAQVDIVSGASDSSAAFQRSLANALTQAQ